MRLTYRGVEYDHNPPSLEVSESEVLGRYRGRTHRFSYVRHVPYPQTVADLKYRGVPYHTNSSGQVEAVAASVKTAPSLAHKVARPVDAMAEARRQLLREAAQAHQASMQRSLERRLEVARAQGNESLIQQLEAEMHQLAV